LQLDKLPQRLVSQDACTGFLNSLDSLLQRRHGGVSFSHAGELVPGIVPERHRIILTLGLASSRARICRDSGAAFFAMALD
jgi:hypothetical protein